MEFFERPKRVSRQIQRQYEKVTRRGRLLVRVHLDAPETRTFWEDLIEEGVLTDDPADEAAFLAFVAAEEFDYIGVRVLLVGAQP